MTPGEDIPFPEMPRQGIPEHQLLLSFRDDLHAEQFSDWLHEGGWSNFKSWTDRQV